jgi:hypothetical protein
MAKSKSLTSWQLHLNPETQVSIKNIVYLSELLHAVSIDLKENISSNPGCEWQLKHFGK